jgi:hypothetical protein
LIDNRIINGGFETGSFSPSWSVTGTGASIATGNSHSGPNSARFAGGTGTITLSQRVPASPGENFEFFVSLAKVGTLISPPISIVISYRDSTNGLLGNALTTTISSGRLPNNNERDWMEIYRTTTVAPAGTTQALVQISKIGLLDSAAVVIDDVALLAVTASGQSGDLTVGGNATVQGNLTVNGTTKLGNESFTDRVLIVGNLETLSNTGFFGPNNVFTGSIFVSNNIEVGSEIIGSGNISSFTIDLFGSESTTETLRVHHGNIEIMGAGFGIILRSPNNTRWLLSVDNSGNLSTKPVS